MFCSSHSSVFKIVILSWTYSWWRFLPFFKLPLCLIVSFTVQKILVPGDMQTCALLLMKYSHLLYWGCVCGGGVGKWGTKFLAVKGRNIWDLNRLLYYLPYFNTIFISILILSEIASSWVICSALHWVIWESPCPFHCTLALSILGCIQSIAIFFHFQLLACFSLCS